MFNSMDTNLVIDLVNEVDRLHEKALSLVKEKSNWVLPSTVIVETKETFRKKINMVYEKIIKSIREILRTENDIERIERLINLFKRMSAENPGLKNFYELVWRRLNEYISKHGAGPDALLFLSELAENMSRIVEPLLRMYIDYEIMETGIPSSEKTDFLRLVEETLEMSKVKFRDTNDRDIFLEIMMNIDRYNPPTFYTDDGEFSKKGKRAYSALIKRGILNGGLFEIERVDC